MINETSHFCPVMSLIIITIITVIIMIIYIIITVTCSMVHLFLYVFPLEAQTGSTTSMQEATQEQLGVLEESTKHSVPRSQMMPVQGSQEPL